MIRIDALWLCAQPVDMRAGADRLLDRTDQVLTVLEQLLT